MKPLRITLLISAVMSIISAVIADTFLIERIAIFGSFAGFQYSLNPGIAWGIKLPSGLQEGLIIIAFIIITYLAINAESEPQLSTFHFPLSTSRVAFGLILGGGIANIIDRLRDGYVTDFIQIGAFPIFNVADSCITVGVGLLLFETLRSKKSEV